MASGKLSPRQKMINMMYLVLMALLALNVSKEILKSFHLMEVSFNKAKENLDGKITKQMEGFQEAADNDPKLRPYFDRAKEAQQITDDFVNYIEEIKKELIEKTGGRKEFEEGFDASHDYEAELVGMDNMEVHANYFIVDNADGAKTKGWKGQELEDRVNGTREKLVALLKSDTANGISIKEDLMTSVAKATQLRAELTEQEAKKYPTWSAKYLEHTPLAGVVTMLSKMQSDAKATQGAVLDVLNQGKKTAFKVEGLVPVVRPTSGSVIMSGDKYEAEIFLAAQIAGMENATFELTEGGSNLERGEDGKLYYRAQGSSPGTFPFAGVITVKTEEGDKPYAFNSEYQVFQGGATISATKMNVLYIGVDNPISVGVPGVSPRDVSVSMQGGSIKPSKGDYVARVQRPGKAVIVASAKMPDGSMRRMGQMEYRVMRLPKPEAKWGSVESGRTMARAAMSVHRNIKASMGSGFAFEGITYRVTGYRFILAPRRGEVFTQSVNGSSIPGGIQGRVRGAKRGDRVLVDKIRAVGPDGQTVNLSPIVIDLN